MSSNWPDRKVWAGCLVMAFLIVLMVACSPATRDRTDWAGISQAMKEKRHDW